MSAAATLPSHEQPSPFRDDCLSEGSVSDSDSSSGDSDASHSCSDSESDDSITAASLSAPTRIAAGKQPLRWKFLVAPQRAPPKSNSYWWRLLDHLANIMLALGFIWFPISLLLMWYTPAHVGVAASVERPLSTHERVAYRNQVQDMFFHGYFHYMDHAFPHDELRPLSCSGTDTLGGYMLTLVDALDALAVFGARDHFRVAVELVVARLPHGFDIDRNVSVFETNIRLMGALVSAHLLTVDPNSPVFDATAAARPTESALLRLALDLGQRLLPAFDTATGMPIGTVNLRFGCVILTDFDEMHDKARMDISVSLTS